MGSFTTHLTALLDPGRWRDVEKQMHVELTALGLWNDGIDVRVQRNYCEEDNMLLDQHMATHDAPPVAEEIHLIRVRSSGEPKGGLVGVEADREITKALAGTLPEGTGWYGTTVGV
ncbi:hypothetical protein ACFWGD_01230 [Corynebacterium sp. NPDC060344]|uniref:hypothetical protein n=1 Tax=Corynebacterium sp. NPDC060344 TaxID=3347101 RepID=UPI00366040C3